jgi:NADPH:quinone reductase
MAKRRFKNHMNPFQKEGKCLRFFEGILGGLMMKAIQAEQPNWSAEEAIRNLRVVEKPIPNPGPGQVLVKMEAAPCNPSDLLFLQGKYGVKKAFPAVPGWEGAGTVVKNGGGILGWRLKGKRVACGGNPNGDGTWAEYYVADAKSCVPLQNSVSCEQGATLLINPLTAVGMLDLALKGGYKAIIQNAACSQVGRMLHTLAKEAGMPMIHIVRREGQVEQMREMGAQWVINSENPNFNHVLEEMAERLGATIAFDAVGGEMTGTLVNAMPEGSRIYVYGALSEKPCGGISPLSLIFKGKHVEGFWLSQWLKEAGLWRTYRSIRRIQSMIGSGKFETTIRKRAYLNDWPEALLEYRQEMSRGKVLLVFE